MTADRTPRDRSWIATVGLALTALVAAAPASGLDDDLAVRRNAEAVIAAADRDEADRERDARRKPVELLVFAGVRPGMRVADLGAGSGYTTELLARAVGPEGHVYAQNPPYVVERIVPESWPARLAKPVMGNVTRIDSPFDVPLPGVKDLDLVTMVFFYHDTLWMDVDRAQMNEAIFAALAPGGSFVVVDHHAKPGSGTGVGKSLHRIDEALLRRELLEAGFQLVAEADFLRNPDDPREQKFRELEIPTDAFVHRYVRPR